MKISQGNERIEITIYN